MQIKFTLSLLICRCLSLIRKLKLNFFGNMTSLYSLWWLKTKAILEPSKCSLLNTHILQSQWFHLGSYEMCGICYQLEVDKESNAGGIFAMQCTVCIILCRMYSSMRTAVSKHWTVFINSVLSRQKMVLGPLQSCRYCKFSLSRINFSLKFENLFHCIHFPSKF